ncbi:DUF4838 domain-containing protein [Cohnella soli]|uniref:DUF4838 domain-containing protein n=1 Tax=Cohnella soli TaxID=425005 RepID=A0ABW0HU29_9BACL
MSRRMKRIFAFITALCMLGAFTLPAYANDSNSDVVPETPLLTVDGNPNTQILISESASSMEQYAANELQKHFKLVSGANVPVLRGDPVNPTLSAGLSTTTIAATGIGYYPFTVTVSNPTNSAIDVTLTPPTGEGDLPVLELGAAQISIAAHSYVDISGLVTINALTMSGNYNLKIHVSSGNSWSKELILKVDYKGLNILRNADIEAVSFSPWWPTEGFYPDATVSHSGNKSIKFTGPDNATSGYESALTFKSGYAYELSFWAKRDASSEVGVKMLLRELDSHYSDLQRSVDKAFQVSEDWTLHRLVFYNNPRNNPEYALSWFNLSLVGAGTIWLDDLAIKEIGRVEVSDAPDYGPNIFKNGSFESDSDWVYESGSSRIEYADAVDGSHVLFVDMANKNWNGNHPYQGYLFVKRNHVYQLGFDAKRAGEDPDGQINLNLTALPGDLGIANASMQVTPSTEWMRYETKFISPTDEGFSDAYWPDLFVPGTKGELYIDNVTLFDLGEATEPVDSTITSSPSKKMYQIIYPEMGIKPELGTSLHELTANAWKILIATPDSYPVLADKFADDLTFIGSSDGFAVNQEEQVIYIFGANAEGALNGVHDFIEANLGVLWTRAIDLGTLYDPMPTIPLAKVNYHEKSPFAIRGWHITGRGANGGEHTDPATEIMFSRNKLNAKFAEFAAGDWNWQKSIGLEPVNMGHNLHSWLLSSPTYQSLSKEKQAEFWNTDNDGNPVMDKIGASQLNFWHPELPALIAESVNAFLEQHDVRYIGVGIEDTWYSTQKPEDTKPFEYAEGKFVQPGDPKYLSTVFFTFLNKVANLVKEEHADATVTTFAYIFTETPPLGEIEDNIAIMIAPINEDMKLPITSTESIENSAIKANMLEWKEKTNNILVYNYYGCFPYANNGFERPIGPRMQADFRFYAENGFTGMLPEGVVDNPADNGMWGISTLSMWLYDKLTWNPNANIQELIELFSRKAYGNAAEPMIEYYRLLQQTWDDNYTTIKWSTSLGAYVKAFYSDAHHNALMKAALDQAWSVANDIQKQRIAPIKTAFEKNIADVGVIEETALAVKSNAGRSAIMADLNMNGPIWGKAPVLNNFLDPADMKPVPGTRTKVRLLWDESNLYVAYENFDERIHDLQKSPISGSWWQGSSDDVETYLSGVNPQGDPSARFRVYFGNPLGDQLVYREGANFVSEPGAWYTSAQIVDEDGTDNDRWVIVQAIPFEQLGISGLVDTTLYGYFYRGFWKSAHEFINIGWQGASVWQPLFFRPITLVDNQVEPPVVTINYATEQLTDLTPNAVYKINGATATADGSGNIAIDSSWMGESIAVVKAGNGTTLPDSAAQTVAIPARPAAPTTVGKTDETYPAAGNGTLTGVTTDMEYKASTASTWISISGESVTGLVPATYEVRVKATASTFASLAVTVRVGTTSTPSDPGKETTTTDTSVKVLVNGKAESVGTAHTSEVNGTKKTTIVVDSAKLQQKLEAEGKHVVVTISVASSSNTIVGELTGQMIKNMQNLEGTLVLQTDKGSYTLPSSQIDIDSIASQFAGRPALSDIVVSVTIAETTAAIQQLADHAANRNHFSIVAAPIDFVVTATYGGKTVEISQFGVYVERTIALPAGIDPNKITTGVVIEADGTVRHVPTQVKGTDGAYYAVINSLTNSTYFVVWHPVEFEDVANHWSKGAVNDMGSRMVIEGTGGGHFSPDRDITRAEFAAIVVRGLGLKLESGATTFSDVKATDWYSGAINKAHAYGLIDGYSDGTFRPNDKITREQAMTIIAKAMKLTGLRDKLNAQSTEATLQSFEDAAAISAWAKNGVADTVQAGLISGRSQDTLAPKGFMTRAEVAATIQRLLKQSGLI